MPDAQPLTTAWGEPQVDRLAWWNVMPGALVPPFHPISVRKWRFDGKEVVADIDSPLGFGYQPHVWTLSVRERP